MKTLTENSYRGAALWSSHQTEHHIYFDVSMLLSTLTKGSDLKIGLPFPLLLKHWQFKIFWIRINDSLWKPFSHVGESYSSDRI